MKFPTILRAVTNFQQITPHHNLGYDGFFVRERGGGSPFLLIVNKNRMPPFYEQTCATLDYIVRYDLLEIL